MSSDDHFIRPDNDIDITERLSFDAIRCEVSYSAGVAKNIREGIAEIERLRQGIMDYLCGNYEHPAKHRALRGDCRHGTPWHLCCDLCTHDHFGALIDPVMRRAK